MIIGTAGHIDHGKSALVTALTGRRVDRLAEEQRRGITIELNFAPLHLEGLPPAGIVDVPGHEDFVRTMVAGATGIDLVLLVIDLAEGPRPQTEEHLAIVEQLRIPQGIAVFTKADLVDPEWAELVQGEVMQRLARSPVRFGAPAIVSAATGQGIDALRDRIRAAAAAGVPRARGDLFRLPVDRVFSLAGVGTVLTGTAWSGTVQVGRTVRVLPADLRARVRSIESFGTPVETAEPGARTALGLAGVDREAVARGAVVVDSQAPWQATSAFDAEIELLATAPRPLVTRSRVRLHVATAELLARVYPRGAIGPGQRGFARVMLETPVVVRGADRFVLRSYSPVTTIGGGRVLDPLPPLRGKRAWPPGLGAADPAERLGALVARRVDGLDEAHVPILTEVSPVDAVDLIVKAASISRVGGRLLPKQTQATLEARALELVAALHRDAPEEWGMSLETLRRSLAVPEPVAEGIIQGLIQQGRLRGKDALVSVPGFEPSLAAGDALLAAVLDRIEQAGLEPPTVDELARELGTTSLLAVMRRASDSQAAIPVERDRYFSTSAMDRFRAALAEIASTGPITPGRIREHLGLSRKFIIPLLEWADRRGVTRRVGDERILVDPGR